MGEGGDDVIHLFFGHGVDGHEDDNVADGAGKDAALG